MRAWTDDEVRTLKAEQGEPGRALRRRPGRGCVGWACDAAVVALAALWLAARVLEALQ